MVVDMVVKTGAKVDLSKLLNRFQNAQVNFMPVVHVPTKAINAKVVPVLFTSTRAILNNCIRDESQITK